MAGIGVALHAGERSEHLLEHQHVAGRERLDPGEHRAAREDAAAEIESRAGQARADPAGTDATDRHKSVTPRRREGDRPQASP